MSFKIENPGTVEFTFTYTMRLEGWKRLREQLNASSLSWPASDFVDAIRDVVNQAEKEFFSEDLK